MDVKIALEARADALFGEGKAPYNQTPVDDFDVISFGQSNPPLLWVFWT